MQHLPKLLSEAEKRINEGIKDGLDKIQDALGNLAKPDPKPEGSFSGAFTKTEAELEKLLKIFTTALMIGGFAVLAIGIYELILSFADDSPDPRSKKKGITMIIVGFMLVSSRAILEYIIRG